MTINELKNKWDTVLEKMYGRGHKLKFEITPGKGKTYLEVHVVAEMGPHEFQQVEEVCCIQVTDINSDMSYLSVCEWVCGLADAELKKISRKHAANKKKCRLPVANLKTPWESTSKAFKYYSQGRYDLMRIELEKAIKEGE